MIVGGQTPDQQTIDFEACKVVANKDSVYIFRDVINFSMINSLVPIAKANEYLISWLLFRTPSGMGVSYPQKYYADLAPTVNAFTQSDESVKALHADCKEKINRDFS